MVCTPTNAARRLSCARQVKLCLHAIFLSAKANYLTLGTIPAGASKSLLRRASVVLEIGLRSGLFHLAATGSPAESVQRRMLGSGRLYLATVLKRVVDVIAALTLIVVTAPVLLVTVLIIACDGPVLFAQTRVGLGDTRFRCFKFRTMYVDAEARLAELIAADPVARRNWETHQKLPHDPRITPFGRVLRRSSLDELPQLINVLRGEMSLVGPRPIIAPEISGYDADADYHRSSAFAEYARCQPGITGLWQVSGRHRTTHAERRRLDQVYARRRSLWLDAYILVLTVGVVLSMSGR